MAIVHMHCLYLYNFTYNHKIASLLLPFDAHEIERHLAGGVI